jgi:hypothetical protein
LDDDWMSDKVLKWVEDGYVQTNTAITISIALLIFTGCEWK